jgi:hypothetical protein
VRGDQLGQHAGERVDLVAAELRAGGEVRRLLGENPLETEHQAVLHLPLRRGRPLARLDLGERVVERAAAGCAGRECVRGILSLAEEGLSSPGFGSEGGGREAVRCLRLDGRRLSDFGHARQRRFRCTFEKGRLRRSPWRTTQLGV